MSDLALPTRAFLGRMRAPAIVAGPGLLALAVGLFMAHRRQLWRDEFATLKFATMPMRELLPSLGKSDAVLGPYYVFMKAWIRLFGSSEISLRLPSIVAMSATAVFIVLLGRKLFGIETGVAGGFLFACLPAVSRFAQEARPYAIVTALAALATLLLVHAWERQPRRGGWLLWVAYAAAMALLGWAHLVAMLLLLAHATFVAVATARDRNRRWLMAWLAATAGALVPVLPLVWLGARQSAQVGWIRNPTWPTALDELAHVFAAVRLPEAALVGGLVIGLAILACRVVRRDTALLGVWAIGSFVVLLAISLASPMLTHRYLLFTLPAWCVLGALAVTRHRSGPAAGPAVLAARSAIVVAAVVALGWSGHTSARASVAQYEPDLRAAAEHIAAEHLAAERAKGDAIAYHGQFPHWWDTAVNYYTPRSSRLPTAFRAFSGKSAQGPGCGGASTSCVGGKRIFLVNTHASYDAYAGMNEGLVAELRRGYEVVRVTRLPGVTVSILRRHPSRR